MIRPQHPAGNAMLNARDQGQPPLLLLLVPLATRREDSKSIKGGTPIHLLLLLLLDIETNLHHRRDSVENHPLLHHLGSLVDSKDRVPAQKDDTDMTLRPLPPPPLLLVLQEDMKLPMKKTRDLTHLNKGPLPMKRRKRKGRKFAHLLLGSGKRSPAVPPLPPPLTHLPGTGKEEKFLALPQYMHLPLHHPHLEAETSRGTRKGGQDPIPRVVSHQQDEDLGLIPDPEDGGGRGGITAEGETMAIITTRADIDKGVGAEIDRRENVGERGEGMVEIGEGGTVALLLTLMENMIEIEREEGAMGTGGERTVALLLKNVIDIEREEAIVGTEGEGTVALLPNLMEDMIETERGKKDLVEIGGEGSVALLLKNAIETEREDPEAIVGTEGGGSVALLLNLIETERGKKDLVEIGGEGSVAHLPTLTMESVVNDMVKEGGGGAPVYVDHRIVTGTGGGAGGGGGGGVDLAADDDVQRYVYSVIIILRAVHDYTT